MSEVCCFPNHDSCEGEIIRHHCVNHSQQLSCYYRQANEVNVMPIIRLSEHILRVRSFDELQDYMAVLHSAYTRRAKYRRMGFSKQNWDMSKDYIMQQIVDNIFVIDKLIHEYHLWNEETFTIKRQSYCIAYSVFEIEAKWNNKSPIIQEWYQRYDGAYEILKCIMDKQNIVNKDNFTILMLNAYDVHRSFVDLSFPVSPKLPHEIRNVSELLVKMNSSLGKNNLSAIDLLLDGEIAYLLPRITYIGEVEYIDIVFNDQHIMWKV